MKYSRMQIQGCMERRFSASIKLRYVGPFYLNSWSECSEWGPLSLIKALLPVAWLSAVTNSEWTLQCTQIWPLHHWYVQLITFKWLLKNLLSLPLLASITIPAAHLNSLWITAPVFCKIYENSSDFNTAKLPQITLKDFKKWMDATIH